MPERPHSEGALLLPSLPPRPALEVTQLQRAAEQVLTAITAGSSGTAHSFITSGLRYGADPRALELPAARRELPSLLAA